MTARFLYVANQVIIGSAVAAWRHVPPRGACDHGGMWFDDVAREFEILLNERETRVGVVWRIDHNATVEDDAGLGLHRDTASADLDTLHSLAQ